MRWHRTWVYNRSGISLIECSLVLLLVTVLVFLSVTHAQFFNRMVLRSELERLYSTCYYLQRRAMINNESITLTLDCYANSYAYEKSVHHLPSRVCFGSIPGVKGPPSSPQKIITKSITFEGGSITFHPTGVIQSGTIYMVDHERSCAYALSCSVAQVSHLRKYQYTGEWTLI